MIRDISTIELDINGEKLKVTVRAADTLLHLKGTAGLTGAKAGCENGIVAHVPYCRRLAYKILSHAGGGGSGAFRYYY